MPSSGRSEHMVNFAAPRAFRTKLKSHLKETFFPDDPFGSFKNEAKPLKKAAQYFLPILSWLPNYNFRLFRYDLLAGLTITSLAIPQGISYAKLADIPPIIGLYSSFVPPFIYAVFGSSKHLAVGTVAAASLMIADTIGDKVSVKDDPTLYLNLIFTSTLITGIFQSILGLLRLGLLVDFLSHSTITGFMGGTAIIIILQQLKGFFGLEHFTTKTDVVSVMRSIFSHRDEWRWETAVIGIIFLIFLQITRYMSKKNPKLFWLSAMAPMATVIVGGLFAYFTHAEKHGVQIVGHLHKGLNPPSIKDLNFDPKYLPATIQSGIVTGILAMAEGIAIGRSFALMRNEQIDGNKEMLAFGLMNIVGSFTSCYLTTGPFSKTAVNFNAGCKTAMSNVVMGIFMMLTLLFLAPLFSYTPLVALAAIITSAMFGLINYEEAYSLFKVDKFDFCICMAAFFGVAFANMYIGLSLSVGLAVIRALLYVARPATCKLGKIPQTSLYRDTEQYPNTSGISGILVLQLGSPIYYANCSYLRERIVRWIRDEEAILDSKGNEIEHVLLDLGGVTSIDMTGIETLLEIRRIIQAKGIRLVIVNPQMEIMEKMILSKFTDTIGKDSIFLSIEDAIEACQFALHQSKQTNDSFEQNHSTAWRDLLAERISGLHQHKSPPPQPQSPPQKSPPPASPPSSASPPPAPLGSPLHEVQRGSYYEIP